MSAAGRHLRRAQQLAARGMTAEAVAEVERGQPLEASDFGVNLQAGLIHLDADDPERALALFERAAALAPQNPAIPVFLGLAWIDRGDAEKAREHLRAALKHAKENRLARGLLAVLALRDRNVGLALRILDKAGVEASPRLMGRLLMEVERRIHELEKDPRDAEILPPEPHADERDLPLPVETPAAAPRESLGETFCRMLVDPFTAQSLLGRAERELVANRSENAVTHAREALRRHVDVPRGHYFLGVGLLHEKRYDEALETLREAEKRDGPTPDVLYALGCCYHEMGRLAEARDALQRMLAAFAKDAAAYYTLGQIALQEGNDAEARRHFERAALLDFLLVRERLQRLRKASQERPAYACPGTGTDEGGLCPPDHTEDVGPEEGT